MQNKRKEITSFGFVKFWIRKMIEELRGKRYEGIFDVNLSERMVELSSVDSDYYYEENEYCWCGSAMMRVLSTNAMQRFLFEGWKSYKNKCSFLDSVVYFKGGAGKINLPASRIIRQDELVDLVLERLFKDSAESVKIVPWASPVPLILEEMVRAGFVAEESGQIQLGLGR